MSSNLLHNLFFSIVFPEAPLLIPTTGLGTRQALKSQFFLSLSLFKTCIWLYHVLGLPRQC